MFTSQSFQFVHQVYPGNDTITESRCPQCGVLIAAATDDKYLAIAESAHKCRMINAPRLKHEDLSRLH
jgi:phage FluMu protein Com